MTAILTMVVGCTPSVDGPPLFSVSGVVNWNGQPLEHGSIAFVPSDGVGAAFGAEITKGKFQAKLPTGPKNVSITSYRISESLIGPDGEPGTEQYLPARYNTKSELSTVITTGRNEELCFELDSKQ
ncbi:MAG TPA: hypothetical protein VNQ76_03900 [Planctomicrobium sp.]|nr:hypothetical protein [Planctomicrobium sp.]